MDHTNLLCHKMKIPETLDHLMYCLTKEILSKQPDNIYEFSTQFFHQLVEERDGSTGTSFLESSRSRLFKPSTTSIIAAGNGNRDQVNEEGETIDDFDKELQQLNDDIRGGEDMSPPPTLDESMSDNDTSLTKIAAVVTSKMQELPQGAIYTSTSRTDLDGEPEVPGSEDTEEAINAFTNETLQEDALGLKQDASSDSIIEVSDEKPPEVDAKPAASEDLGEPEPALVATEETSNVAHALSDSDEIEGTSHLEAQAETLRSEEVFSQENTEEEKEIFAEMVDVVDSSTPQAEIPVDEELLNSSPLEDLPEAKETTMDNIEDTEIVIDQVGELENAASEPADPVKNEDNTPDVVDITIDADAMEESVDPELREAVNEIDAVENELQEIVDEEQPQGIGGNISETSKIEDDLSQEIAEEEEQTIAEIVDVVDSSTLQAEEEPLDNMEISNSAQLETEIEADCVDEDIPVPSSADFEEACPVEIDESNQLDIEETGSLNAEGESGVAQEQGQEVEPFEISYLEEQIQEENEAIEDGEREEENDTKTMDTRDEKPDDDNQEMDGIQPPEAESLEISDIVDEQPSQVENIEENLTEIENMDLIKDPEAFEILNDGEQQDVPFIEDKSPPIHANEDTFLEVEDTEQDDGFSQDVEININADGDANEAANDAEDAVHSSHDEHHEEGVENLELNDESLNAASDGIDDQFLNSDLENATTALDRILEVEDVDNEKDNSSINAQIQNEHTPDIDLEEEGKISNDTEMGESEVLNLITGVTCDENSIQGDNRSVCSTDITAEDGTGLNAPSLTENVTESESAVNEEAEAEPNDTASLAITEENHDLQAELDDTELTPDLKANALLDEDFNELLYEGDKEVSNDDEEEIWSKLQKDLQLEEEEQQTLAAIKIQSTFRGYKSRKDFNHSLENTKESEGDNHHVVDDIENVPEDQVSTLAYAPEEPLESNDYGNGLTRALAGVTESIATVALIMTDTPQHQPPLFNTGENQHDEELLDTNFGNENATDTSHAFPDNQREVYDVAEEPMSNGEEIRDIQLIESYVITSSVADSTSLASPEVTNVENDKENGSNEVNDDSVSEIGTTEAEVVDSDPGVVFELYVESNETINDGLLESYCVHREDPAKECFQQDELDSCLYERENVAATKIQAGFRGHQDRKRVRDLKNDVAENVAATKIQAGFRGHQDRKRVRNLKNDIAENVSSTKSEMDNTTVLERENAAATAIQAGFRGNQVRKRIKDAKHCADGIGETDHTNFIITEEKSHFNDGQSPPHLQPTCSLELENAAATKIQAGYRGQQDRKRVKQLQHRINEKAVTEDNTQSICPAEPSNVERDLQCLEELENAAATKIQAGFRGYKDRKNTKHLKSHAIPNDSTNGKETNFPEKNDLLDSHNSIPHMADNLFDEETAAATKIQAGFRGHQDRKRVKCLKDSVIKQDEVVSDAASFKEEALLLDYDQSVDSIQFDLENTAATKIQAGFRGQQDRKRVKNLQRHKTENDVGSERADTTNGSVDTTPTTDQLNEEQSQENELENAAATKIQSSFRGHQDRKKIKHLRNRATHNDLVNEKETVFEEEDSLLDLGQDTHDVGRNLLEEENAAATKIQAGFRGQQDRKRVKFLKDSVIKSDVVDSANCNEEVSLLDYDQSADSIQVDLENNAATKIQAGFRGHQDRKRVKQLQRRVTESDIERGKCTNTIPTPDKSNVEQIQETLCLIELENAAATKIQASYRGHQDRKKTKHLKNRATSNDLINQKETIFVQENSLIDHGEQSHDIRRNSLEGENAAATKIQAGFRGQQDRKRVKFLKDSAMKSDIVAGGTASSHEENSLLDNNHSAESIQVDLENAAATKIQAGFRGHQDRKRVKNLQHGTTESLVENDGEKCTDTIPTPNQLNEEQSQENLCMDELENAAATKIQAGFRGYQERKNLNHLKNQTITNDLTKEKEITDHGELIQHIGRNSLEEENCAAIKIQAGFRGHQDRKRVKYLKDSIVKSDVSDNGSARHNESLPLENDQDAEAIQVDMENNAATKIQAGFRGHQDRKRVKNLRNSTDVA